MASEPGMVIVGAGECGARAALTLREEGYEGPVMLIGREPHLPYERPPLSKDLMLSTEHPAARTVIDEDRLKGAGIEHFAQSEVVAIDRQARHVVLGNGSRLPYEKLLLATGCQPRRLPAVANNGRCVTLRTFDDALAIRAHLHRGVRLAIVGGGFIGLELAAAARQLGCPVTVLEAQPRILMRGVPEEIAAIIHAEHAARGVHLHCGASIEAITESTAGTAVRLDDGTLIEADIALIGIGAVPETALAESAGLALENGIAVDAFLQTGDPAIFAAGDCCSFPLALYSGRRVRLEAWRNAQEQGALAARNMLGSKEAHAAVPWFWSDQYDLGLQIAGLTDEGRETVRRDMGNGALILFHLAADGRLVAASGIGPGNTVAKDIRLAEMLIARRASPPPDRLAAPEAKLKTLLAA
jgi:3-phenylpropionate/trans-cinnamate dioxygenase ferredoxin reductase subunit